MTRLRRWVVASSFILVLALACAARADVRLPRVIGSSMVLQRDVELPVWGWAEAGETVTVKLGDAESKATADAKGKWTVKLPAQKVSLNPLTMTVSGKNTLTLNDILVGEVWVCSGQSNMEMTVASSMNSKEEIPAANFPQIRLFQVAKHPAGVPRDDVDAGWQPCTPQTIPGFSAVAYFFGRDIHKELNVPVGMIHTSWGGTRIEPWTPPAGFAAVPAVAGIVKEIEQANADYRKNLTASLDGLEGWIAAARKALADDAQVPSMPSVAQHPLDNSGRPTGLYNGMVHGIVPFAIRGALWYQGESNRGEGMLYFEKMKALIGGWRTVWNQGEFPFLFAQLAPYRYGNDELALPKIWEAQTATLAVPNTGMAVLTDVTTVGDIHPPNKQAVGHRLALWALAKTYGREKLVYSGPLLKAMEVEGGKARLKFDHVGSGLASRDGKPLTHFQVAGEDKKFADAQAAIDGETVVVSAEAVPKPVAVRFGWHETVEPNLMNKEGLPASPFRTDKW